MKFLSLLFFITTCFNLSFSQDYKAFLNGTFKYCDKNTHATITFKRRRMIEEFKLKDRPKVKVIAKIKWLSENSYRVTALKVQGEITSIKVGDSFQSIISKIDGDKIFFTFKFDNGHMGNECFEKELN